MENGDLKVDPSSIQGNNADNGNAKQHNIQCHNDYAVLQYNTKLAMLLQGWGKAKQHK